MANSLLCLWVLFMGFAQIASIILVVPEDVPAGFAAVYGFAPRIVKGNDHRFGFGFRLGNHADFQVMYQLGPQLTNKQVKPSRIRSATYRQRVFRRRPLLELLLALGLLKETSYEMSVVDNDVDNEPR